MLSMCPRSATVSPVTGIVNTANIWNGDINGNPVYFYDITTQVFSSVAISAGDGIAFVANNLQSGTPMGTGLTGAPSNGHGNNFQAFFDWVDLYFPGVTNSNMTWDQYFTAVKPYGITQPTLGTVGVLDGSVSVTTTTDCTGTGSFIMFSKDNKVNLSSVLGYYASATFRNDSTEKAELFNVGADVFESSK